MKRTMLALMAIQIALLAASAVSALSQPRAYTELDTVRLEKLALARQVAALQAEGDACRAILGPLRARAAQDEIDRLEAATFAAIEAAHPGFRIDRQSGRLVAIPVGEEPPASEPAPDGK
jgi:hypothetical protein